MSPQGLPGDDPQGMSDEELEILLFVVQNEIKRRDAIREIPGKVNEMVEKFLAAEGIKPKDEWRQCAGGHNCYPLGWTVTRNDRLFVSLIDGNATMPGDPDDPQSYRWWKDITDEEPDPDPDPEPDPGYVQEWDGNDHPYTLHELVMYLDIQYWCRLPHRSQPWWTPDSLPTLWLPGEPPEES